MNLPVGVRWRSFPKGEFTNSRKILAIRPAPWHTYQYNGQYNQYTNILDKYKESRVATSSPHAYYYDVKLRAFLSKNCR